MCSILYVFLAPSRHRYRLLKNLYLRHFVIRLYIFTNELVWSEA